MNEQNKHAALTIAQQYPPAQYNLLVPMQTVTEIADIQKPVMNSVKISTDLNDGEIYEMEKAKDEWRDSKGYVHKATPAKYALTKKGLTKLMRAAGIKILSSRPVVPSTCQKCAAVSTAIKKLSESGEILNEEKVKTLIKEQVENISGGGCYGSYELTLSADGWKPARDEGDYDEAGGMNYYQCIYDAELPDSTSELIPSGAVMPGGFYITNKAGVLNGCETHDGFVRFFAQRIPEADIQVVVNLFGKGGGSGETGSVSIGQGLKRDSNGAITVRIGDGLDFDSTNALTVRKETVMTSEDLLDEEETQQEIVDMLK